LDAPLTGVRPDSHTADPVPALGAAGIGPPAPGEAKVGLPAEAAGAAVGLVGGSPNVPSTRRG
jgi:hypothetical protein